MGREGSGEIVCWEQIVLGGWNKGRGREGIEGRIVRHSLANLDDDSDRLCGLVVRVSGDRYRGPAFDSRRYQIF